MDQRGFVDRWHILHYPFYLSAWQIALNYYRVSYCKGRVFIFLKDQKTRQFLQSNPYALEVKNSSIVEEQDQEFVE